MSRRRSTIRPRPRPHALTVLVLAAVCLCLLGGCAGGSLAAIVALPTGSPAAAPPDQPRASGGGPPAAADVPGATTVEGAQALVFANRYDDADQAYARLVAANPRDIRALAGWALLLTYRLDYDAARRQVNAALAVAPHDARALAVRCRLDDWSGNLVEAVSSGQDAVAQDRTDVLAHLFLSEALADHGDLGGARNQVASAKALVSPRSPVYEQAELQREIGNLARATGDLQGELAGYQEAFRLQPGWVERPSELASAYLDNGDMAGARTALRQALDLAPQDAALLQSLGSIAMLEADYETADAALGRLAALRPDDASALLDAAHAHMAHTGDVDGSVALLERAVTAAPADLEAAAYLLALERYVRGDPARGAAELAAAVAAHRDDLEPGRVHAPPPPPPVDVVQDDHRRRALAVVNEVRRTAGLPPVVLDPALDAAALQHCFYWLFNNGSSSVRGLGIHEESPDLPGYSGVRAGDRAEAQGWHSGQVGEDITHRGAPEAGVNDWVNSVYHRFAILRPDLSAVGYGDCSVGALPMEDMEFGLGNQGGDHHSPVAYPANGQSGVPVEFVDNELPDPVPAGRPRTTGYPVTVTFDPREHVVVSTFTLTDDGGRQVDGYLLQPGVETENGASLLPVVPLASGHRYVAHIAGHRGQDAFDITWAFSTG